jgi:hypothetical protein
MFDANCGTRGMDNTDAEDIRLLGYDPMLPPAIIQEEIPAVHLQNPYLIPCSIISHFFLRFGTRLT